MLTTRARGARHSFGFMGSAHLATMQYLAMRYNLQDKFVFIELVPNLNIAVREKPRTADNRCHIIQVATRALTTPNLHIYTNTINNIKARLLARAQAEPAPVTKLQSITQLVTTMYCQAPSFHNGDRTRVKLTSPLFLKLALAIWQGARIPLVEKNWEDYTWLINLAACLGLAASATGEKCIQVTPLGSFLHAGWWAQVQKIHTNLGTDVKSEHPYARLKAMTPTPENMSGINIDLYRDAHSRLCASLQDDSSDDESSENSFVMD